jgi:chemotaxis protein methyltransferase CheR
MVYARLSKRVRSLGLGSFAAYCDLLRQDGDGQELAAAVNAMTTNLTRFFREGHHFDHLSGEVLPALLAGENRRLRFWSAGCSTGEEAYSIAMVLAHALAGDDSEPEGWDAKVLATDIDTDVLGHAARGHYALSELGRIPTPLHALAVVPQGQQGFVISDAVHRLLAFKPLNLMGDWPMKGPFDAIFCRNVAIYFTRQDQLRLFDRMADLLTPDGYLYIGHSENLFGLSNRFQLVARTIYRRIS